jgi:hypothetical protein
VEETGVHSGHADGPSKPGSAVLTTEQEALIVAFGKHTLLPLDDSRYALQTTIHALNPIRLASVSAAARHQPPA